MTKFIILFQDFKKLLMITLIFNILLSIFLYSWVTDSDFTNLPPKEKKCDRFIALLYYNAVSISTCGYGDIVPISNRARIFATFYLIAITVGILSLISGYLTHKL